MFQHSVFLYFIHYNCPLNIFGYLFNAYSSFKILASLNVRIVCTLSPVCFQPERAQRGGSAAESTDRGCQPDWHEPPLRSLPVGAGGGQGGGGEAGRLLFVLLPPQRKGVVTGGKKSMLSLKKILSYKKLWNGKGQIFRHMEQNKQKNGSPNCGLMARDQIQTERSPCVSVWSPLGRTSSDPEAPVGRGCWPEAEREGRGDRSGWVGGDVELS